MTGKNIWADDPEAPRDLPAAKASQQAVPDKIIPDAARICPSCKKEATRITSSLAGRHAFCTPCKMDWPIGPAVAIQTPQVSGRGLAKQVVQEPDWALALETDEEGK